MRKRRFTGAQLIGILQEAVAGATVVDDFTRESVAIEVDTSLPGERVVQVLERLAGTRGLPTGSVCDNGPEFAGQVLEQWAYRLTHANVIVHDIDDVA